MAIGTVDGIAMGDGVFKEHRAESGEGRSSIERIVGCDDACAVIGCFGKKHLVDVAVAQEESELVVQLAAVVKATTNREEAASGLKVFDTAFDAGGQVGIWKE